MFQFLSDFTLGNNLLTPLAPLTHVMEIVHALNLP